MQVLGVGTRCHRHAMVLVGSCLILTCLAPVIEVISGISSLGSSPLADSHAGSCVGACVKQAFCIFK